MHKLDFGKTVTRTTFHSLDSNSGIILLENRDDLPWESSIQYLEAYILLSAKSPVFMNTCTKKSHIIYKENCCGP